MPRPVVVVELLVFEVSEVNFLKSGVLLLAKLNLLCLEMLVATFFLFRFLVFSVLYYTIVRPLTQDGKIEYCRYAKQPMSLIKVGSSVL